MSLLEEHKAERRARILAAARELIAARGFEGLTMRDLARASRVSVPTLYNLFGGKHALLLGELEETFAVVAAGQTCGGSLVDRVVGTCEAANRELLATPRYSRELIHVFLTSNETQALRRQNEDRYVTMMAALLAEAQDDGAIVEWVDPATVARRMFAHYVQTMILWAKGDLDTEEFRAATLLGMGLMLLGLARGRAARQLERLVRDAQPKTSPARRVRARKGG